MRPGPKSYTSARAGGSGRMEQPAASAANIKPKTALALAE
jgi:hypothetical protein